MSNGTGKRIATILGVALSVLVISATLGATFPTKEAISQMIATESPYVKDQSLILYRLASIERKLDKVLELGN